ncbi:MAG: hypothetical protein DHS80DRAFT_25432 [Piptocephalis tieghemiana]|nr:MAG: hypothetical protein DHS80DRAFT_25432 [Piptocephalis tieghemiana]
MTHPPLPRYPRLLWICVFCRAKSTRPFPTKHHVSVKNRQPGTLSISPKPPQLSDDLHIVPPTFEAVKAALTSGVEASASTSPTKGSRSHRSLPSRRAPPPVSSALWTRMPDLLQLEAQMVKQRVREREVTAAAAAAVTTTTTMTSSSSPNPTSRSSKNHAKENAFFLPSFHSKSRPSRALWVPPSKGRRKPLDKWWSPWDTPPFSKG